MRKITVAAIQMGCGSDVKENIEKASELIREAAAQGAQIILPPELFERPYFCQERRYEYYGYARTPEEDDAVIHMKKLAKELETVIPVSFYEAGDHRQMFNSVAVIDADGSVRGIYRKTHIPDDHYYQEKFYFTPGDTGFRAFKTRYGTIGVGICWDQWFPETARGLALKGAELLFYPTAIGSEPILGCGHCCKQDRDRNRGTVRGKWTAEFSPHVLRFLFYHRRNRGSDRRDGQGIRRLYPAYV